MADDMPKKLGKYEIISVLGQGAMGIVYIGFDPGIERKVALKTIRKDVLDKGDAEEMLARFKREAQAAGRLLHPNIVSVYEYGEDADTAFIAMEFVKGKELKSFFDDNQRFELDHLVRVTSQILDALEFSHAHGVVHRDIKPANIFVMEDGTVKLGDFGIARVDSSNLTQAGTVMGTPSYMSPEQFMGQRVDGRSDLFSVGVILYQFLTSEKPFTGSLTTIMHKVMNTVPENPSALNISIPPLFDKVVQKAIAKRSSDRFQTASEFSQALVNAFNGESMSDLEDDDDDDATMMAPSSNDDATMVVGSDDATIAQPMPPPKQMPKKQVSRAPQKPQVQQQQQSPPPPPPPVQVESRKGGSTAMIAIVAVVVLAIGGGVGVWQMTKTPDVFIDDNSRSVRLDKDPAQLPPVVDRALPVVDKPPVDSGAVKMAIIRVETEPAGAVIELSNGEFLDTTPTKLTFVEGEYDVVIKKEGYEPYETGFDLVAGEKQVLNIILNPIKK